MIFHITTENSWQQALNLGEYHSNTLKTEGIIHCSTLQQLIKVANAFYRGQEDLIVLCIEPEKLNAILKWEPPVHLTTATLPSVDIMETFPHIYGSINLDAVVATVFLTPNEDGSFELPPRLLQFL